MILSLIPPQYRVLAALGAAVGLLAVGAWTGNTWTERRWEAAVARQEAEAARALAEAVAAKAATEAANRALTQKLDLAHAEALQAAADSRDAFSDELTRRVRDAERRARRNCPVSGPVATDHSADTAGRGEPGPRAVDVGRLRAVRDAALSLQAYARTCHNWVKELP